MPCKRARRGIYTGNHRKFPAKPHGQTCGQKRVKSLSQPEIAPSGVWHVYLIRTAAGLLYTGISTDPERRLLEHGAGTRGSRMLRGKGPLQLVFRKPAGTRSMASKLEARIKKLSRLQKLQLVSGQLSWALLSEAHDRPDNPG